jgi:hypothetical protein
MERRVCCGVLRMIAVMVWMPARLVWMRDFRDDGDRSNG